jgi:hypothetical protein
MMKAQRKKLITTTVAALAAVVSITFAAAKMGGTNGSEG